VLALEWGERRLANVHKLLRLARAFQSGEGRQLRAFLDHVEHLVEQAAVEPDAPVDTVEPDAVRLMTVHAAKGLEFPVVCVADLGRSPNARSPDLLVSGDRIGLRLMRLDGGESLPALDYDELCDERRRREADEEDRVFYVAMTRARELLVLSGAADFARWPRPGPSATPVSWLAPALIDDLPGLLAGAEPGLQTLENAGARPIRLRLQTPATARSTPPNAHSPTASGGSAPTRPERSPAEASPSASGARSATVSPRSSDAAAPGALGDAAVARARERMSSFSYSSLSELERCGYRYYVERVLGLPEEREAARSAAGARGLEARARGTLVHLLLESLDFAAPRALSAGDVARAAEQLGLRVEERECSELAALVAGATQNALAARIARAASVRREHPFAFSLGEREPLITGVIDLLAVEPGGVHVVLDYKSDRVAPDADLAALVEREYAVQRLLYALAVLREGAPSVEIVHWFLERDEYVSARYAGAAREALERALAARIEHAHGLPFAVSEHPHRGLCMSCPARAGLCSWDEARTMREQP
jgi:ATP-dependent exoDNAse (exonuclease V) beta subunit